MFAFAKRYTDSLRSQLPSVCGGRPPRSNRTVQRDYDRAIYKERHLIECLIGKLKHFRVAIQALLTKDSMALRVGRTCSYTDVGIGCVPDWDVFLLSLGNA